MLEACPVHCRMFSSSLALYSLRAVAPACLPRLSDAKCPQTLPIGKCKQNHWHDGIMDMLITLIYSLQCTLLKYHTLSHTYVQLLNVN